VFFFFFMLKNFNFLFFFFFVFLAFKIIMFHCFIEEYIIVAIVV